MTHHTSDEIARSPIAKFGANHGYAIDGDIAWLNADILVDESRLCGQNWFLQLWADGLIKIAELALGVLPINGHGFFRAGAASVASLPAGQQAREVSLVLVDDRGEISDRFTYPHGMAILQPQIHGTVHCHVAERLIDLSLECIRNPRQEDNLSGTLALELWLLDTPYTGGAWAGTPVASAVLGTLSGQSEWRNCTFSMPFAPFSRDGYLTLMLREWSSNGYITRDFQSVNLQPDELASSFADAKIPNSATKETDVAKPAILNHQDRSLNTADLAEILTTKGISVAVGKAILAHRPYRTWEDVLRVKGVGPKLMEKLRFKFALGNPIP